jgi:Protein of unknown function (DUF2167)
MNGPPDLRMPARSDGLHRAKRTPIARSRSLPCQPIDQTKPNAAGAGAAMAPGLPSWCSWPSWSLAASGCSSRLTATTPPSIVLLRGEPIAIRPAHNIWQSEFHLYCDGDGSCRNNRPWLAATAAKQLAAVADYKAGARHADFSADSDTKSEYVLAGLVAAVADITLAKRVGFLALVLCFGKTLIRLHRHGVLRPHLQGKAAVFRWWAEEFVRLRLRV